MEKPKNPPTNFAVTGIYFLTPKIFDVFMRLKPSWRNELEITDALQILLEEKNKIDFEMITDYWKDTGTPEDIIHANSVILENMTAYSKGIIEQNVQISGSVMIGENSIIKSDCKICGPVIIGQNSIIESNTIIGSNTSIGDNVTLKECKISNSIIMNHCKINGKLDIKNSIISFNSNISKINQDDNHNVFILGEGTRIIL